MRCTRPILSALLILSAFHGRSVAAEVDVSKLPAASTRKVEFEKDIKPIFEASCLKCHGPEKPKSRFRLDNKEMALKGGEQGVAIIAGQSAKSPLIHFVAKLVKDMEMPPTGKGEPLTAEQIGLLRAWVDQGVDWTLSAGAQEPKLQFSVTTGLRYLSVSGNESKFRERLWMTEGWAGGITDFWLKEKISNDTTFTADGRAVFDQHDFRLRFDVTRQDYGFLRGGAEQYRKYFDDGGGVYAPLAAVPFRLNQDLHLDVGRAWFDVGLTLPDWPKVTLGYEHQYKEGSRSTLQWGVVDDGAGLMRNIYPSAKAVDEQVHILKLDVSHDVAGLQIDDSFRLELYDLRTDRRANNQFIGKPGPDKTIRTSETHDYWQAANALRLEKQLTDWLLVSGGYLYSRLDADAFISRNAALTANAAVDPMSFYDFDEFFHTSRSIILQQQSHVFNANLSLEPVEGLTLAGGVQSEWMAQDGFGDVQLDEGDPDDPFRNVQAARLSSDLDRASVDETFLLRFTRIPFTVVFAEARLQQESIGQSEGQIGSNREFLRDTDASSDLKQLKAGFTISPWRQVSFTGSFKHREKENLYDNRVDEAPLGTPGDGYPALARARNLETDEFQMKLTLKPASWVKAMLTYQLIATDHYNRTLPTAFSSPGGELQSANFDSHVYGANLTLTPWSRLFLSTSLSYYQSQISSPYNRVPTVANYEGDLYSISSSATYVISKKTDMNLGYTFSRADYAQSNIAAGLPAGVAYEWHGLQTGFTHRFKDNLIGSLQYSWYNYDEGTALGASDFSAHGIMASLTFKLP